MTTEMQCETVEGGFAAPYALPLYQKPDGASCQGLDECTSGACTNGACTNGACGAPMGVCSGSGG